MTPIEHRVLVAVKTLLEASLRPAAGRVAEQVELSTWQVTKYLNRLHDLGYLAGHDAWLRYPTALGMQAIARGPDELPKGPGRPKMGLGRPGFTMLYVMAFGTKEQVNGLRTNPRMKFVNLSGCLVGLRSYGYVELFEGDWRVSEAGLLYLATMRDSKHAWWLEEQNGGEHGKEQG